MTAPASPTKGELQELFIGDANYVLVRIPPKVWNGVKGLGSLPAMIANCASHAHDPAEIVAARPVQRRDPLRLGPEARMSRPRGECDLAVVGGGILGLATARELIRAPPRSDRCRCWSARARSAHTRPATTRA